MLRRIVSSQKAAGIAAMNHALKTLAVSLAAAAPLAASPALAGDKEFFESAQGVWVGPGEIVAGKYKGTKFTCRLNGSTPAGKVGMTLDGSCRVGVFSQKMSATIERRGGSYRGKFLDGAAGEGLDIVSGKVSGKRVTMNINRSKLSGAMTARIPNANAMNVAVSVRVDDQMIRVIGMDLKRVEGGPVGDVAAE